MDCYIVIENEAVKIQCTECHGKNGQGYLWPAIYGQGPTIVCECGNVIHQPKGSSENQTGDQVQGQ